MAAGFFSRLNYSFGNEDWETEQRALQVKPDDRILCITASGDRPLNILSNECKEVVAIDANPLQNYLLQLKLAAIQGLNYDDYIAFLGAKPTKVSRSTQLQTLLNGMDSEAGNYWLGQKQAIDAGILYQGAVEKLTSKLAFAAHLLRPKKVDKLFSFSDLEEQQRFIREEWDTSLLRKTFNVFMHPSISTLYLRDPGLQGPYVPRSFNIGKFFYKRMTDCLMKHLAVESSLSSLLLRGFVTPEGYTPYLTEEGHAAIKSRAGKIKLCTSDLIGYLETCPEASFDAFSLSDVASYIGEEDFRRLLKAVYRAAKPSARFCIRQYLSCHEFPQDLLGKFNRENQLEEELENDDRCFVYRFMVGSVQK